MKETYELLKKYLRGEINEDEFSNQLDILAMEKENALVI